MSCVKVDCAASIVLAMVLLILNTHYTRVHMHALFIHSLVLVQAWVKKGVSGEGLRPQLPEDADPAYVALLKTVWAEDPLQRPSFTHLLKQLEALSPQRGDLMDNLVNMVIIITGVTPPPAEYNDPLSPSSWRNTRLTSRL